MSTQRLLTFDIPFSSFDVGLLAPDSRKIGSVNFKNAVTMHFMAEYASKGLTAMVMLDDARISITVAPQNGQSIFEYAVSLLREGKLKEGLDILQCMSNESPKNAEVLYNIGICHSEMQHFAEAIAALNSCVEENPNHVNAWVGLGVAHQKLGQTPEAETALRKAITLDPGNGYANRNLGAVLTTQGRDAEALPHFREAVHQLPGDPGAMFGLAQCLEAIDDPETRKEAESVYREIIQRFSGHPVAEMAREAMSSIAQKTLRFAGLPLRMDVVMYMLEAMKRFDAMSQEQVSRITLDLANLGRGGLDVNNPDIKYDLKAWPGEKFTGLNVLSIMHVGIKSIRPEADSGMDLDREYTAASSMFKKKS